MTSIRELHVVLSDYCNIKCNYCSVYKRKDVSQYIIDKEAFKLANSVRDKALLENVHFDIITLIGGEPTTVSPSVLAECVNILQDVCNIVSIQTNGVAFGRYQYFNSFKKNIKNKYKLNISISCDGPQGIHDLNRDNSYKYVEKAIDSSIKYIGEIGLVCVIGRHTIENKYMFESWIETILKNKAIHPQIRVEMGKDRITDSEQVKLGKIIIDNGLYPYSEVGRRTTLNKGNNCDTLVVSTNTIVRGCLKFTNTEVELDMTSINENTFDEIVEKRKELFSSVLISEDCKTCKYKDVCNSGCPLFRKATGKANECFLRKTVYKEDCNLYGEDSGCFKKVVKAGKKVVKSVAKAGKKVVKSVAKAGKKVVKSVAKVVGKTVKSIGKELERWGEDIKQVGKVLTGEYHREAAKVKDYQNKVEAFREKVEDAARAYANGYQPVAAYRQNTDELMERLERLIAFDEIFKLALKNRFKDMDNTQTQTEDPRRAAQYKELQLLVKQYELMVRQLKQMMASLKADYDFVIGLTEGAFLQRIVGSVIMMVGGLVNNISNVFSGEATSEDWKNIIIVVIIVIAIVLTAGAAASAGAAFAAGTGTALAAGLAMTALVLAIIGAFMTLDGMYANGAATGAIMSSLDFIFNDLLNLDDFVGKDFNKFDKDHEDYQEMVMYTQLAVAVGSLAASWGSSLANSGAPVSKEVANASIMKPSTWNMGTASVHGTGVATNETAALAAKDTAAGITNTNSFFGGVLEIGDSLAQSSVFGLSFTTYSDIYEAFTIASNVKDMIAMNDQYNQLGNKLTKEAEVINAAIVTNTIQKTRLHIADSAYFLQDQQEYIDRYIWSMVSDSMYVDPYGTTPVANIRFQPDKDTRMMNFGFEDMFDESKQAGSKGYFNNIIYGS